MQNMTVLGTLTLLGPLAGAGVAGLATGASVTAEANRATAAEAVVAASVTAEVSRALLAEGVNATAITTETTARIAAVTGEATARVAGDTANTSAISTEASTARGAEALAAKTANNLSDLASASSARTNLGLGTASTLNAGTSIGQVLGPLINYQGSGLPALLLSSRLILARSSAAATDNIDIQVQRNATFTGGTTANINKGLFVSTTASVGNGAQEWNLLAQANTNGTAGGLVTGLYAQGQRLAGGSDAIWASISDAKDFNVATSSLSGAAIVGHEIDISANRADDAANPVTFGGVGSRKGFNIIAFRRSSADAVQTEFSNGMWFTTGTGGSISSTTDALTNYQSVIGFGVNTQIRNALDTRGAITPAGSSNPVSAVTMTAGHVIDFSGGAALTSAPGRYLTYNSAGTKLQYLNAGTEEFAVSDTGTLIIAGGPTLANSSGVAALHTAGGAGLHVANTTSGVNGIQVTPGATGVDPILAPYGGDASRNLRVAALGSGSIVLMNTTTIGFALANSVQFSGGATTVAPTITLTGSDANISLVVTPKGTGTTNLNGAGATVAGTLAVSGATTLAAATGVTATGGDNSTKLATTAFVASAVTGGAYTLPTATASVLGGVKPDGTTLTNASGAISVTYGTGSATAAQGNDSRITGALAAATAVTTYAPLASPSITGTLTIASGPTLASGSGVLQMHTAGGAGLNVANTTSGVNGIQVTPGATGVDPIIAPYGGDASRNLRIGSLGTGIIVMLNTTSIGFALANSVQFSGGATTVAPAMTATGSDPNISLNLVPKGTGVIQVNGTAGVTCSGTPTASFASTSGLVTHC